MSESISIGWLGPTNDPWGWILSHFLDTTILSSRNIEDWIASQCGSCLFIAIESRFDPVLELVRRLEKTLATIDDKTKVMAWCALLGGDWAGHRRTFPLPESIPIFYWYELYDRLFPWLVNQSQAKQTLTLVNSNRVSSNRRVSPRTQSWIETSLAIESRLSKSASNPIKLALIVTETATTRQLWIETLSPHDIQCVATNCNQLEFWSIPDLVVVDIESEPLAIRELQLTEEDGGRRGRLIRKLASQFPSAIILVADAFPRWENWRTFMEFGADMMISKPFQFTGILDTIQKTTIAIPEDPV